MESEWKHKKSGEILLDAGVEAFSKHLIYELRAFYLPF